MKIVLIVFIVVIALVALLYFIGRANRKMFESARVYEKNFSTPEGAVLCLEEAYRQKDLEKAVTCKDFLAEARLMLAGKNVDHEVLSETAETLELSFRAHFKTQSPEFEGVDSRFLETKSYADGVVVVTEICRHPNGMILKQKLLAVQKNTGWRVLIPL